MSGVSVFKPCDEEPCALNNPKRDRQEFAAQQGAGGMFGIRIGQGALNECPRSSLTLNLTLTLIPILTAHRSPLTAHRSPLTFHPHPSPNPNQVRGMARRLLRAIAGLLPRAAHGPGEDGAR